MAIEELYADRLAEHYEELAHHFRRARSGRRPSTYLVRSGDRAKDAYANQTALDFYARALEASEQAGAANRFRLDRGTSIIDGARCCACSPGIPTRSPNSSRMLRRGPE